MRRGTATRATALGAGIENLVAATLSPDAGGLDAALAAVAHPRTEVDKRQGISTPAAVAIYRRDCWTCRYCGVRTIAPPVLRLLSELYPDQLPFHPNWKAGQVHPAYLVISTSLDHLVPGARGGSWRDPSNLVTACWACNTGKADLLLDEIAWELLSEEDILSDWDGLTNAVPGLWERAGRPDGFHREWRRALADATC